MMSQEINVRTLTSVVGNSQKLDGGAMFGNAPKALWSRWVEVDAENRISLACRCLLVRDGQRQILFETGIGAFFEPKMQARYGIVEQEHILLQSLEQLGLSHEDIDVVVLSHLHFDHAGGLLSAYRPDSEPQLLFPNAEFLVGTKAWQRAQSPHFRDRASFIAQLAPLLLASGRLRVISPEDEHPLGDGYHFWVSHGHTPGLLLNEVTTSEGPVVFAADLIPGMPWVHLPITMGYDRYPELLIDEKQTLLDSLVERGGHLFFTHDHQTALAKVTKDERGRFVAVDPQPSIVDWG